VGYCTGAGESGKSTVLKQMKLIYASGFSKSEKEEWRAIIFSNILNAFKVIVDAMEEMGIDFDHKRNDVSNGPPRRGGSLSTYTPLHAFLDIALALQPR
jgi:hypothetical protein